MKECIQPYYLHNGKVLSCDLFNARLINEGISVYEVVRLMESKLLFLEDHLKRLFSSVELAGLHPVPEENIISNLQTLLSRNPVKAGNIKIVLNEKSNGSRHFLVYFVKHRYPSESDYINGVKVITYPFEREDPNKKIWRPDFRKSVAETLEKASAYEALLTDQQGFIREGSKSNVFAISRGSLFTPPDEMILPGITRSCIINISGNLGIPVAYQKLDLNDLHEYDSIFLSGTSTKVLPVARINELPVPTDSDFTKQISEQYNVLIQEYLTLVKQT